MWKAGMKIFPSSPIPGGVKYENNDDAEDNYDNLMIIMMTWKMRSNYGEFCGMISHYDLQLDPMMKIMIIKNRMMIR